MGLHTRLWMMGATGSAPANHWIATTNNGYTDRGNDIIADSSGNCYVCGQSNSKGFLFSLDTNGQMRWQKELAGSSTFELTCIAPANFSTTLMTGGTSTYDGTTTDFFVGTYNLSDGGLSSDDLIRLQDVDGYHNAGNNTGCIYRDGSLNYYLSYYGANASDTFIVKYNQSHTLQWGVCISSGNSFDYSLGVVVGSAGDVYAAGYTQGLAGSSYAKFFLIKFNSSGTVQWQRKLYGTAAADQCWGISIDSSDNTYLYGYTSSQGQGGGDALVAKYNSSGTLQWQRRIGDANLQIFMGGTTDASGNVYCVGYGGSGSNYVLIVKYNSTGTLQWQRTLQHSSVNLNAYSVFAQGGNLYIAGTAGGDALIIKVPDDGSLTGTYGSYVYASSSLTAATATLTEEAANLTTSNHIPARVTYAATYTTPTYGVAITTID